MTREMVLISKQKYESDLQRKDDTKSTDDETDDTPVKPTHHQNVTQSSSEKDNISSLIDIAVPSKYKEKTKQFLSYLRNYPSIKWNERGEVSIEGETISSSHIVDLVRDLIIPGERKAPIGFQQFYSFLNSIHIPQSLISNGKRKQYLHKVSHEEGEKEKEKNSSEEDEKCTNLQTEKEETKQKMTSMKKYYVQRDMKSIFQTKQKKKKQWLRFDPFF